MNIILSFDNYNKNSVFFSLPHKNNVIENGKFIRIIYSNSILSLNNIIISLPLLLPPEKSYTKYTCHFDVTLNKSVIDFIKRLERDLLQRADIQDVPPSFHIASQLDSGQFKYITKHFNKPIYCLKISGICITDTSHYLTFKFIQV